VFPDVKLYLPDGGRCGALSPDQCMVQEEVGVCPFSVVCPSQTLLFIFSSN